MRVIGIFGPLNGPGWRETDPKAIEYDTDPARLIWANENLAGCDLTG
jgi:hypothetical protein